jgi:serine/threonine protein kinase
VSSRYLLTKFTCFTSTKVQILTDSCEQDRGCPGGTLAYMSPEQFEGVDTHSPQSDLYSLGATLYVLLSRELPLDVVTRKGQAMTFAQVMFFFFCTLLRATHIS